MTQRTLISQLQDRADGPVTVQGWVDTVRDQKKVQFVVLHDETGGLQLVNPRSEGREHISDVISTLAQGTMLTIHGDLKHDERVKLGGLEVKVGEIVVESEALPETPIAEDTSIDKRLDWRFLDLRTARNNLLFRAQTTFAHALRTYWVERDYVEIFTPKLMGSPSETRAELFEVEYFDRKAYLAQSPQFYKQMAQSAGFGKVFEIGPVFRADPSFTSRHATEFTGVDAEISWIDSHEDVMTMQEELLVAGLQAVADKHGDEIREHFGVEVTVPALPFPRIPLLEARAIVGARGHTIERGDLDLDPEGERQIAAHVKEQFGHEFVFLTDYPASIRPFYHMRHDEDASLTKSYDLIWNGVEITTGAQREHRVDVIEAQAREKGMDTEELGYYLDFFRYGTPPHGGFGMGLARVMMLMLGLTTLREVTFLFRGPNRLTP
ncbi:aspartate--tRNA(Asn) ligase [Pseudoclavibacter endophyticus]|uniref:Aspartate--tRNA ligase n=1 Tax=Pseudoclavibacter endophyticus TaxID=1778590 RepID=A0A6H9WRK3_9MICO|nr:aspartate--tRNA(Asn) ligase [Pseudoclavibacter endophyticus]KAB1648934.1 aspartate--tRNA(Asn) ligase [Pseudoclavibacter endophyticus]GGA67025.1 aspartate--tRNA(Asn) ligase [Pseudoclavibacter endophyticus]